MFVIVAVAIYGALLGLSKRPALRSVVFAAASVATAQYAAIWLSRLILHRAGMEGLAWNIQNYAGADARDLIPTASAASFAAAFTALAQAATQSHEQRRRLKRVHSAEE